MQTLTNKFYLDIAKKINGQDIYKHSSLVNIAINTINIAINPAVLYGP